MRTRLTLAAMALTALAGCSGGPEEHTEDNAAAVAARTDTQPSEQDRSWMRTIHESNLAEVQAGRLAMGKGSKKVKPLGEMLLQDHTKLGTKVTRTAEQLGIRLPTSPSAAQRAEVARLRDSTGQDFDQDFLSGMVKAHTEALAATRTEISQGSSPTVKALAKTAQQSLQKHLTALREAQGG